MPGLQSMVSAWTKINHDHLKYALEEEQGGGRGEEKEPRNEAATLANTPQLSSSLPSSSSLSSFSLSRSHVEVHSRRGAAGPNSLASMPAVPDPTPPSQTYQSYHHEQPQPQLSSKSLSQQTAPPQRYTAPLLAACRVSSMAAAPATFSSSEVRQPSRPSQHHQPRQHSHGRRSSHHFQHQLDVHPPFPRAGAGAILSRRHGSMTMGDPSMSINNIPSPSTNPNLAKKGATLAKSPSTSLWHSVRSLSSNRSNHSASNHSATSVTASLSHAKSEPPTTLNATWESGPQSTHPHGASAAAPAGKNARPTANNWYLNKSCSTVVSLLSEPDMEVTAGESHRSARGTGTPRNQAFVGFNDSLVRNGPPEENWRQDWFPGQPLPSNGTVSSDSSSSTVVTRNRKLASQVRNYNDLYETTSADKHITPPTTVDNDDAATLPFNQSHMGNNNCDRCSQLEMTLLSLQADVEYVRTLELQREFVCKDCDNASAPRAARLEPMDSSLISSATSTGSRSSRTSFRLQRRKSAHVDGSTGSRPRPDTAESHKSVTSRTGTYLRNASKRLSELSTRHKRQVKQGTHERAYWQNEMHLKLEKFALMAKNLNEEAARRADEARDARGQLESVTSERNALAGQANTLRARVELYEDEGAEQARLREEWRQEKAGLLDFMDSVVGARDATIGELSSRLVLAVEIIERERQQQRTRRQIMFPPSSRTSLARRSKLDRSPEVDDLEPIHKSKEALRTAQRALHGAMAQHATRQKDMQLRLNAMEQDLAEARASMTDGRRRQEGPVLSIRHISSSVSLGSAGEAL